VGKRVNRPRSSLPYERDKLRTGILLFSTAAAACGIIQLHDELASLKLGDLNC